MSPFKQLVSMLLLSAFACASHANPSGATVVNGTVSFSQPNTSTLNITNTPGAIVNWQQFGIAQGELTHFIQQSASSAILNRVTGQNPSQILGQLQSNGRVFLINPNGVIFGQNAVIDTAGMIASTLNISDENFLNGHLHFEDLANNASILNQGFIHTSNAGEVVLVAPTVENEGVIDVEDGHLVLAAGQSVTVSSLNYDNIEFEVQAPDNKVVNLGDLISDGGSIGVFAGSIQNSGTVSANAIKLNDAGEIVLVAQDDIVLNEGSTVTASSGNGNGGDINITAHSSDENNHAVLYQSGDIIADGVNGGSVSIDVDSALTSAKISASGANNGGSVAITANRVTSNRSSSVNADGDSGGDITVTANEQLLTSARYSATGYTGGDIHLLGTGTLSLLGARVDAGGVLQGGNVRVGGDFHGEGLLPVSAIVRVDAGSVLDAGGTYGDAGTAVIWSDTETYFTGLIDVGSGLVGDGGIAEVSSKGSFAWGGTVNRASILGNPGTLLLDPVDINVIAGVGTTLSFFEIIDPNPTDFAGFGGGFYSNDQIAVLSNGNIAVTDPYDGFAASSAGAVYLFGPNGSLISTLTGSTAFDYVGSSGIYEVANNNFVVGSQSWHSTGVPVGAATWINGTFGLSGAIAASNSLVGSASGDSIGSNIVVLSNGNYVVASSSWDTPGGITDVGAVTFGIGAAGVIGTVDSATNSIIGSQAGDQVGKQVVALDNGNYVIASPLWDDGTSFTDAGLVVLVDGTTGKFVVGPTVSGVVSSANGLYGPRSNDNVGGNSFGGMVTALPGGNYVVASPNVDTGTVAQIANVGAVTFVNGTTGEIGGSGQTSSSVSIANSLMGSNASDFVGSASVTVLNDGDYVVRSYNWNGNIGAATWVNGGPVTGTVSGSNSIIGNQAGDNIGLNVQPLSNGNFVVGSTSWANGGLTNAGAVVIGDGSNGHILVDNAFGAVTTSNSLFGATTNDRVGNTIVPLSNGNVAVGTPSWNDGVNAVGAVTLINGSTGEIASQAGVISGSPDATNSLIGSSLNDSVGNEIAALTNGNYVLASEFWDGSIADVGIVSLASGINGASIVSGGFGAVDATNSLVGLSSGDLGKCCGDNIFPLVNGNFVVAAPQWDNPDTVASDAGAVVFVNGFTGEIASSGLKADTINTSNSLHGTQAFDNVSGIPSDGPEPFIHPLANGDYVVASPSYNDGANTSAGAVSYGNGVTGTTGDISTFNSIIGDKASEQLGSGGILEMPGSNFIIRSPNASTGTNSYNGRIYVVEPGLNNITYPVIVNGNSTLTITAGEIANILANGNLSLQASNDFTLNAGADIIVSAGGSGNDLSIQAGRSILLNADIFTDGGYLFLVANDYLFNGVVDTDRAAGAAVIQQADGATIDTGAGNLEIDMQAGDDKTNSTGGDIILSNVNANHIRITQNALNVGASVLRTATGTITASSIFIDHFGLNISSSAGSIGTLANPLQLVTDNLGAHIHAPSTDGIYINATPLTGGANGTLTIGDTCYANGTCGSHIIQGIETLQGGDIVLNVTGSLSVFDPVLTTGTSGDITLLADGDISITSGLGDIDSSGALNILAGGNFNNTVAAMSANGNITIDGADLFINATGITDLTTPGNVVLTASGQISNGGATGTFADVVAGNLVLLAESGVELDFDAASVSAQNLTSGIVNLFDTASSGTLNVILLENPNNDISLSALNGAGLYIIGPVTGGNTAIDLLSANGLSVFSSITGQGSAIVTLDGDSDGNGVGDLSIMNPSAGLMSFASASSFNLRGASVSITGGGAANAGILIESTTGDIDIDAYTGDITITGGTATNTGIVIRGGQAGVADVSLDTTTMAGSGNIVLQGGSGDGSSVIIEATDTDPLTVATNNLSILAGTGNNSDAFFNAFNGAGNVDVSGVTGSCTNCIGISDPLNSASSDAGIWAANFPTGPITFIWDDDAGNGLWSDPLNWSSDILPGLLDDATIGAGFSATLSSTASINSLTLDGTLTLSLGGSLTLGSSSSFSNTSVFTMTGGVFIANGGFTSNGSYTQNAGTATFNGANTFNTVSLGAGNAVLMNLNAATTIASLSTGTGPNTPVILGSGDVTVTGASTLNNADFGPSGVINFNGGVDIRGTLSLGRTMNVTGASSITGAGSISGSNGLLNITGGTFTVQVDSSINTDITMSGGTFRIDNGAALTLATTSGSFTATNLQLAGGASITGTDSIQISNTFDWIDGSYAAGALTINAGATMNMSAATAVLNIALTNNGLVDVHTGGLLELQQGNSYAGNFNIAGGGVLDLSNGTHTLNGALSGGGTLKISSATATLDLTNNGTVGSLQMLGGLLTGNGNLTTTALSSLAGGTFGPGGNANFNGGVDITGLVTTDRPLNVTGGSMSGTAALADAGNGAFNLVGGVFTIGSSNFIDTAITIQAGTFDVLAGGTLNSLGSPTVINNDPSGTLNIDGQVFADVFNDGTLTGVGSITGNVTNGGDFNPGNSPGTFTIFGDLVLLSSSNLNMEIAGLIAGQYDILDVQGNVVLDGMMNIIVDTSTGYSGQLNDTFTPIKWVSNSGGALTVVSVTPGYTFNFTIDSNGLSVVAASVPGSSQEYADLPSSEALVFTDTLKAFTEPFSTGTFDEEDEEERGQTLVCS